jgi:hypothetical protein
MDGRKDSFRDIPGLLVTYVGSSVVMSMPFGLLGAILADEFNGASKFPAMNLQQLLNAEGEGILVGVIATLVFAIFWTRPLYRAMQDFHGR